MPWQNNCCRGRHHEKVGKSFTGCDSAIKEFNEKSKIKMLDLLIDS